MTSGITESSVTSQGTYSCYVSEEFVKSSINYDTAKFQRYVYFQDTDTLPKETLKEMIASIEKEIKVDYSLSFSFF